MKEVNEIPKEGQFVAMWNFRGNIWSGVFRIEDGEIFEFNDNENEFELSGPYFLGTDLENVKYFVMD